MKKFFYYLFGLILLSGISFIAYKSVFRTFPEELILIANKNGDLKEIPREGKIFFYPYAAIPNQVKIFRLPLVKKDFEIRIEEKPPLVDLSGFEKDFTIRLNILGTFIFVPGKVAKLYRAFSNDLNDFKTKLQEKFSNHLSTHLASVFTDQGKLKELEKKGNKALQPAILAFQEKMLKVGLEINNIHFGLGTNIADFASYLAKVYNSPEMVNIIRQKAVDIAKLKQAKKKEKIAVELDNEIKNLKQKKNQERLEQLAKLIKKSPEVYQIMVLEKLGKNIKVIIMPKSEKFPDISKYLNSGQTKKEQIKKRQSPLKPGEFLE